MLVFHQHLVENQSREHHSLPIYSLLDSVHKHSAIMLSDNSRSQFVGLFLLDILSFLMQELKTSCTNQFLFVGGETKAWAGTNQRIRRKDLWEIFNHEHRKIGCGRRQRATSHRCR